MNTNTVFPAYELLKDLFPICRSITGEGVRKTLQMLQKIIPLEIHEVESGTKVFDWTVPQEWNIEDAYIITPTGEKVCDFKKSNLHLVSYSIPFEGVIPLETLQEHLYSLPSQPDAIPYVTSYYKKHWGFCIDHNQRMGLIEGDYKVVVKSTLKDGFLTYGELIIPGKSSEEIFISTYVCHPSMANNELSGPVVTTFLAKSLLSKSNYYTYRFIFIPETIGSLTYLAKHLDHLKKNVKAGYVINCIGDRGPFSYLPSRNGSTLSDRAALHVLKKLTTPFKTYTYLDRGSDERQYCSPGVDLPIACIMRSKHNDYPEYHTSLDNLDFVDNKSLNESIQIYLYVLETIELNCYPLILTTGEPQLGRRGLYSNLSIKGCWSQSEIVWNLCAVSDGKTDLIEISEKFNIPAWEIHSALGTLVQENLIKLLPTPLL